MSELQAVNTALEAMARRFDEYGHHCLVRAKNIELTGVERAVLTVRGETFADSADVVRRAARGLAAGRPLPDAAGETGRPNLHAVEDAGT